MTDTQTTSNDNNQESPESREQQNNAANAQRRIDAEKVKLREETDALRKELEDLKTKQIEEQKRWKEAFEELKPKYEKSQTENETYQTYFTQAVEEAKAKLSKDALDLLPEHLSPREQLTRINKAREKFANPDASSRKPQQVKGIVNPADPNRTALSPEEYAQLPIEERAKRLDEFVAAIKQSGNK